MAALRMDSDAKKLDDITYDELLKLARRDAQVIHVQAVITTNDFGVELEIRACLTGILEQSHINN